MQITVNSLLQTTLYPTIYLDETDNVAAPSEYFNRWMSTRDHKFDDGRFIKILITWTSCEHVAPNYEPLAELNVDGTISKFLVGLIQQPNMNYSIVTTYDELEQYMRPVTLVNPDTNYMYQLTYASVCVSKTLFNMITDLGGLDDTPIQIGANVLNSTSVNTLMLLNMLQIIGNLMICVDSITNWNHINAAEIDSDIRILPIDTILKIKPSIDETALEKEIATVTKCPQFKFCSVWTDYQALKYYITAADFLDIQPLCMYLTHACATKLANI